MQSDFSMATHTNVCPLVGLPDLFRNTGYQISDHLSTFPISHFDLLDHMSMLSKRNILRSIKKNFTNPVYVHLKDIFFVMIVTFLTT